ncbi:MAG: hypothetical protein WC253_07295 [Sulfurovaceae bacterium]
MDNHLITPEMLSQGIDGLCKISKTSQTYLRNSKKLTYTKILRNVYYKREWIEDYINSNIRPAKTSKDENLEA